MPTAMTGAGVAGHVETFTHRTWVLSSTSSISIATAFLGGPEISGGLTTLARLRSSADARRTKQGKIKSANTSLLESSPAIQFPFDLFPPFTASVSGRSECLSHHTM